MKALALIDIQNDFIDGSLGVGPNAFAKPFETIRNDFDNYDIYLVTRDCHPIDHCSFSIWPKHCVIKTKGQQLYGPLAEKLKSKENVIIRKKGRDKDKEEYGVDLLKDAKGFQIDSITLAGLCYDYCVKSCAERTKERHPGVEVVIHESRTVSIKKGYHLKSKDIIVLP